MTREVTKAIGEAEGSLGIDHLYRLERRSYNRGGYVYALLFSRMGDRAARSYVWYLSGSDRYQVRNYQFQGDLNVSLNCFYGARDLQCFDRLWRANQAARSETLLLAARLLST